MQGKKNGQLRMKRLERALESMLGQVGTTVRAKEEIGFKKSEGELK